MEADSFMDEGLNVGKEQRQKRRSTSSSFASMPATASSEGTREVFESCSDASGKSRKKRKIDGSLFRRMALRDLFPPPLSRKPVSRAEDGWVLDDKELSPYLPLLLRLFREMDDAQVRRRDGKKGKARTPLQ